MLGVLGTYSGSERGSSIGMSDGGSEIGSSVDMHLGSLWERPCWVQIQVQCQLQQRTILLGNQK